MSTAGGPQQIDLTQLPLPQLNNLSQQLDQELEFLNNSIQRLRTVQRRFAESLDAVKGVGATPQQSEVLVPLTSSLYVPGEIVDNESVVVDIGTGFYTEKTISQAVDYFQKRIDEINKEIEQIMPAARQKSAVKSVVMEVLQAKVQHLVQQQQAQKGEAAAPAKA